MHIHIGTTFEVLDQWRGRDSHYVRRGRKPNLAREISAIKTLTEDGFTSTQHMDLLEDALFAPWKRPADVIDEVFSKPVRQFSYCPPRKEEDGEYAAYGFEAVSQDDFVCAILRLDAMGAVNITREVWLDYAKKLVAKRKRFTSNALTIKFFLLSARQKRNYIIHSKAENDTIAAFYLPDGRYAYRSLRTELIVERPNKFTRQEASGAPVTEKQAKKMGIWTDNYY